MNQQKALAKMLHLLAECIDRSSASDLEALLAGQMSLSVLNEQLEEIRRPSQGRRNPTAVKQVSPTKKQLLAIASQLSDLGSREEGLHLLQSLELNKRDLEQLARTMDLPVPREDDIGRLRDKIVEASIGSRLNSQAIRGA
jgi:hypothetical protein